MFALHIFVAFWTTLRAFAGSDFNPVPLSEQDLPDADQLCLSARDLVNLGRITRCNDAALKKCVEDLAISGGIAGGASILTSSSTGVGLAAVLLAMGGHAIKCVCQHCEIHDD
jgi:hypothetical protein